MNGICSQNTNYAAQQHYVPRPLDICDFTTNIDDVGGKKRYSRNILQWSKNDFKSKNNTNGDYLFFLPIMHTVKGFLV